MILLAALLRIWKLDIIPPGLTPDEASLGYNAYCILKTGRDEYGKLLPIIFKSFGDYKPGLYIYSAVPFVALFGLNEWSVRLPSTVAGVVAVYLVYFIILEFFRNEPSLINKKNSADCMALTASFLLAISPWHIHFSRGGWEVNLALTLTLAGIYFFLKSLKNPKFLVLSSLLFSFTLITYQGAKLSTLIVVAVLFVVFFKETIVLIKKYLKVVLISICLGTVISFPILFSFATGQTGRLQVFSIFSYKRPAEDLNALLSQNSEKVGDLNYIIFHNNFLFYKSGILARYFNHFSGRFLFFEGDYQNPRHSAPNQGMLLLFDIILLPIGIVSLIRSDTRYSKFILLWLMFSPLPAVLTRDQVQAVRAYNMLVPITFVSAAGLTNLIQVLRKLQESANRLVKRIFLNTVSIVLCMLFTFSLIYYLDSYFIHLPIHNAKYWFYGYKQVVMEVSKIQNSYQKVIFQQSYDQPYIYFLFYQRYDPRKYQLQANLTSGGLDVGLVEKLDNISFVQFSWPYGTGEKNTLVVGNSVAVSADWSQKDYSLISEIKYPDNFTTAFRILETK